MELNNIVYKHLDKESKKPHENNDIIFPNGITEISVNDKIGIPIGKPGKPFRKNVRKLYASLGFESNKKSAKALDYYLYKASMRPSLILMVKISFESKSWRKVYVTILLKDGPT